MLCVGLPVVRAFQHVPQHPRQAQGQLHHIPVLRGVHRQDRRLARRVLVDVSAEAGRPCLPSRFGLDGNNLRSDRHKEIHLVPPIPPVPWCPSEGRDDLVQNVVLRDGSPEVGRGEAPHGIVGVHREFCAHHPGQQTHVAHVELEQAAVRHGSQGDPGGVGRTHPVKESRVRQPLDRVLQLSCPFPSLHMVVEEPPVFGSQLLRDRFPHPAHLRPLVRGHMFEEVGII